MLRSADHVQRVAREAGPVSQASSSSDAGRLNLALVVSVLVGVGLFVTGLRRFPAVTLGGVGLLVGIGGVRPFMRKLRRRLRRESA